MRKLLTTIAMATLLLQGAAAQPHKLWYERPAAHWLEALPVGNSHLGAMVYGGTDTEEIQLIVSILTAIATTLGTTSCMGHGPFSF